MRERSELPPEYAEMWARAEQQEREERERRVVEAVEVEPSGFGDALSHEDWYDEEFGSGISAPPNW
ncbi:hypothetical protein ACFXHA_15815 [Nocardia sp. NPDC059240]|uniref:hypothetical protein n=1 Tax=Nocardia sp. NPDC059240 TaxID=3346786 RepID=UPI0036930AFB